jgi:hypothetical protein
MVIVLLVPALGFELKVPFHILKGFLLIGVGELEDIDLSVKLSKQSNIGE